jgi:hypothetical protein
MANTLNQAVLECENSRYRGSGARSQENQSFGFRPAFRDTETGIVYLSRFSDGRPAPFHLLDGLPDDVVLARSPLGGVEAVKQSVVSGFILERQFFTRNEAAAWMEGHSIH